MDTTQYTSLQRVPNILWSSKKWSKSKPLLESHEKIIFKCFLYISLWVGPLMIHFTKKEENSSNIENKAMETSYGWYFITDGFILTLKKSAFWSESHWWSKACVPLRCHSCSFMSVKDFFFYSVTLLLFRCEFDWRKS